MTASKWGDKDILAAAQRAAADAAAQAVKDPDGLPTDAAGLDQLLEQLASSGTPPLIAAAHAARCSKALIEILAACHARGGGICDECRDSALGAVASVLVNVVAALPDDGQITAMDRFALAVRRQADMHPKVGEPLREFLVRSRDQQTPAEEAP